VAKKRFVECSFLIPVRRDRNLSDGKAHGLATWSWLEDSLNAFGGATRAPALYEGWYLDPDTREPVRDQSRRYIVAVATKRVAGLRKILRQACVKFAQKCIYLSVAGYVEFVEGPSRETD
jgi:hypothetical protein